MPQLPALIDLSGLGTLGNLIQGAEPSDGAGFSVSSAGDINDDGFDDVIVGAPFGASYYGAAYVLFGDANGISDTDLGALAPTDGFRIVGNSSLSFTGCSVSSAGDVNDDGYADIIVGAQFANLGDGAAYLIFGKAAGLADIDLAALDPADGFAIAGTPASYAGNAVSSGDVNGDGFTDLIVGARADGVVGAAYVVFGKASGFADVDLATLGSGDGFAIRGIGAYDRAGFSVGSADVNGDGYADVLVGAPNGAGSGGGSGNYEGRAYVIFGKASGLGDVDLATLAPADGFAISGADPYDYAGYAVASAGDINGDGFDEIIVSSPYEGAIDPGAVFVIFGKASGFVDLDLDALAPADGFAIRGEAADDHLGFSLSGAGDVNGDGFADLLVGALNSGALDAGSAYLIYGKAGGFGDVDLATLDPADGVIIRGAEDGDFAGNVSFAGDVDGDGFDDLMVGARSVDLGGTDSGQAYIIYGVGQIAQDDAAFAQEDGLASGSLFADNGSGVDKASRGITLEVTQVDGSAANVGSEIVLASGARLTVNSDGTFSYDPDDQLNHLISAAKALATGAVNVTATDLFTYRLLDGPTATVTITINGVDSADDELWGDTTNNTITGLANADFFRLSQGGDDTANGGGGNDSFHLGDAFTSADSVEGGIDFDVLILEGDYSTTPLVLESTSLTGMERILLEGGFSYDISSHEANVAAGQAVIITGNSLGPLDVLNFDGSAESDGYFLLIGGDGDDALIGGAGSDTLVGRGGTNQLDGGGGNDWIDFASAPTAVDVDLDAGFAFDNGFGASDVLVSIENISGSTFDDTLAGDEFANLLVGGLGGDTMTGRGGDDTYVVDDVGDAIIELPGEGDDKVRSWIDYSLTANIERLQLVETAEINGTGNALDNHLTGNQVANVLDGGVGIDRMKGDGGDDNYVVDDIGDLAIENSALDGVDTVQSSVSFTLGAFVENLVLTGLQAINATGNNLANQLVGNEGANLLAGGGGADEMQGEGGDDIYLVDNVGDLVTENSAIGGIDTVRSSVSFTLTANLERLVLTGLQAINGTGNGLDNNLTGNGAANVLDGSAGADRMKGDAGDDIYVVDNIGDLAIENRAIEGIDTVQSSVSFTLGVFVENLTLTGSDPINATGNGLANNITGNNSVNVLTGLGGNDQLRGGNGNDSLTGGAGQDGYYFDTALNPTDNVDAILDFNVADDAIHLDDTVFTGLAIGPLAAEAFRAGSTALDADDRILYDNATGNIYFDADGVDGNGAVLFATVSPGTTLGPDDFIVF